MFGILRRWFHSWLAEGGPGAAVPPVPLPRLGFREGDTFAPARLLALDEPLAVLYGTSQALACCALASGERRRKDSDTVPVHVTPVGGVASPLKPSGGS